MLFIIERVLTPLTPQIRSTANFGYIPFDQFMVCDKFRVLPKSKWITDAYLGPMCAGMRSTRSRISGVWVQFASAHKSADKCGGICGQGIELHTYVCNGTVEHLAFICGTGGGAFERATGAEMQNFCRRCNVSHL